MKRPLRALNDLSQFHFGNVGADFGIIGKFLPLPVFQQVVDDDVLVIVQRTRVLESTPAVVDEQLAAQSHDLGKAEILHLGHGIAMSFGRFANGRSRTVMALRSAVLLASPARDGVPGRGKRYMVLMDTCRVASARNW